MTSLRGFRDHCAEMARAQHRPNCQTAGMGWWDLIKPDPACNGCVSDEDRALWQRLADEVDDYEGQQLALFGEDA